MRAWIYDRAFMPLTIRWYRDVLERLEPGTRLLDIGIGTAGALVANAELVKERDLRIYGVDIDPHYVAKATKAVGKTGLSDRVSVALESIYDHTGGPYDAAYFGASFMLMPEPVTALRHVITLLRPGGHVYFTQTFQQKRSPFIEKAKPLLVKVTTIDFGRVTYEPDFRRVLDAAQVEVVESDELGRRFAQSYRCVVARPRAAS